MTTSQEYVLSCIKCNITETCAAYKKKAIALALKEAELKVHEEFTQYETMSNEWGAELRVQLTKEAERWRVQREFDRLSYLAWKQALAVVEKEFMENPMREEANKTIEAIESDPVTCELKAKDNPFNVHLK